MPGEPVPGHVGDGVDAVAERTSVSAAARLSRRMPDDRLRPFRIVALGERQAGADRLRQHQHVTGAPARLAEHLVGVHDALHRQTEDRLGVADRVAAGDRASRLGHDLRGGLEDRRDRVASGSARGTPRR